MKNTTTTTATTTTTTTTTITTTATTTNNNNNNNNIINNSILYCLYAESTATRPITETAQCTLIVKPEVDYKPQLKKIQINKKT
jgi:hypothetical protein